MLGGLIGVSFLAKFQAKKSEVLQIKNYGKFVSKTGLTTYCFYGNTEPSEKSPDWYRLNEDGTPDGFYRYNDQKKAWLKA